MELSLQYKVDLYRSLILEVVAALYRHTKITLSGRERYSGAEYLSYITGAGIEDLHNLETLYWYSLYLPGNAVLDVQLHLINIDLGRGSGVTIQEGHTKSWGLVDGLEIATDRQEVSMISVLDSLYNCG